MYFEAFFIGIKEGLKLSLCLFLILQYIGKQGRPFLKGPLLAGVLAVIGFSFYFLTFPATAWMKEAVVKMTGYVFGIFYLGSLITLYHETGDDMLGPLKRLGTVRALLFIIVFFGTVLYFSPDMIGSSFYLQDLIFMGGKSFLIFGAGACGFLLILTGFYVGAKYLGAGVFGAFRLSQILLLLALVKLIAGGIRGFTELSLIPSVQRGLMKLTHDVIHHTLVTIMVPDHQILSLTAWNFLGIFFGKEVSLWLSLILLSVPLALFLIRQAREAIPVPADVTVGAIKRKYIKSVKDIRLVRAIPIAVFIVVIVGTWFAEKGGQGVDLYNPEPVPAVAEQGTIILPISGPGVDLLDGMLHKYSLALNGENVRIMVLKKADGALAIALDACEICPPDGYAQGREHVVCLYCNTPIAIDTLGQPGGCNPIPLDAVITDTDVRISLDEIERKWKIVKNTAKNIEQ